MSAWCRILQLEKRACGHKNAARDQADARDLKGVVPELDVDMMAAPRSVLGAGPTDRGTLAHWPGGIVVGFPKGGTVNGTLVMAAGDINLTFKRASDVADPDDVLKDDYVTDLEGEGADAAMMRAYLGGLGRPR